VSATEVAWVWKHSPYTGALFNIHMAIADSANDDNDRRFWMASANLAKKARCTPATARRALGRFVKDGYLEVLGGSAEERQVSGRPSEYRFLFPEAPIVYEPVRRAKPVGVPTEHTPDLCATDTPPDDVDDPLDTPGVPTEHTPCAPTTHVTQENTTDLKKTHSSSPSAPRASSEQQPTFADFWRRWPKSRRMNEPKCRAKFERLVANGTPASVIVAAVDAWLAYYAAERTEERYIPHTTTWLHDQRWTTPPPATSPSSDPPPPTQLRPSWLSNVEALRHMGADADELESLLASIKPEERQAAREAFHRKETAA